MSTQSAPSARCRPPQGRGDFQRVLAVCGFCALLAGYLLLYCRTNLGGTDVSRFDLLRFRLLLPEQSAASWFGSPASFSLWDRVPIAALAALVMVIGWLVGRLLLALFRADRGLTRLDRVVYSCGVGFNTISLYLLAIGLAGCLSRAWLLMPSAGVLVAGAGWFWRRRTGVGERKSESPRSSASPTQASSTQDDHPADWQPADWLGWRWLALGAPFVLVILLGGMLPPIDFDVREYHLEAPKEFYQRGRIEFLPHNVYGNMPLGSEMLSLLAMVLVGDWWVGALVGKALIAAFAPLTALALVAMGRRFFSMTAGVVAAVLYLSVPWITLVSTSGLIECVLAFYLLLSLYAVLLWRGTREPGLLALAGYCAGAAISCKYPAVLFVAAPLSIAIAWSSRPRIGWPVAIFLLAIVAGCGLWFAKNWVLTGNPTYPLLYEWFGGATRGIENNSRWQRVHSPADFQLRSLWAGAESVLWKSDWISPVLVPLALMACLARRYRRGAAALAAYLAFVFAAWWCCTHRIDRFWIPVMPVAALLAGVGAAWSNSLAWRRMVLATLALGLGMSLLLVTGDNFSDNRFFVALDRLRSDPSRGRAWHCMLNDQMPPSYALLTVGDAAVFDLHMPVYYNTAFDGSMLQLICQGRSPREIAAELERLRISHIYVHWGELARYRQPGNYGGVPGFVTVDWFAELVRQGVLAPPLRMALIVNQEVYPVVRLPQQLDTGTASWPRLTPAAAGLR